MVDNSTFLNTSYAVNSTCTRSRVPQTQVLPVSCDDGHTRRRSYRSRRTCNAVTRYYYIHYVFLDPKRFFCGLHANVPDIEGDVIVLYGFVKLYKFIFLLYTY